MSIRLTVIVASYNYEQYIQETLDSLLNQSNQDFEILVIDDGSTDNSVNVIREYASKDSRVRLLQHPDKKNHGLPASVKLAVSEANGEYIAFCESDDYWDEMHVEKLFDFLDSHPSANLLFNKINVVNLSSKPEYDDYVRSCHHFLKKYNGKNIFHYLSSNYMPTFSCACVKKNLLLECDFSPYYPQYLDFWLWRQLCVCHRVFFVEESITFWRKHDKSYDMTSNIRDIKQFLSASDEVIQQNILKKQNVLFRITLSLKRKLRALRR